ncbi:MAG TPA: nuclear transport factor 2 family protein [Ohtaekwangia sp.]|nr:nuclear transport factor 2 family protein [Ohtaekwangia sp.]
MRFLFSVIILIAMVPTVSGQSNQDIHQFIDRWHQAAAEANADVFFSSMSDQCIYIGTADYERWTKTEFIRFAKPYFDKGKAWDFKPYDRDLHVTSGGNIVWFSELLTTWMGVCRGSGILIRTHEGWKFAQYHLSVTVPNEIIGDFIKLVENYNNGLQK